MESVEARQDHPWVPGDTFGARLALIRQYLGLNMSAAAKHCGINEATWTTWERGAHPRDFEKVTAQIATAAGCDLAWLRGMGSGSALSFTAGEPVLDPTQLRLLFPEDRHLSLVTH